MSPMNKADYPADWIWIREGIVRRAENRCEGSPAYPDCRAENGKPHPETGSRVILTVAHLDHDTSNNAPSNLRAWCQRCHLTYDAQHHAETRRLARQAGLMTKEQAREMLEQWR